MDLLAGGVDDNLYNDLYENETALDIDDSFFESPVRIAATDEQTYYSWVYSGAAVTYFSNLGCGYTSTGFYCKTASSVTQICSDYDQEYFDKISSVSFTIDKCTYTKLSSSEIPSSLSSSYKYKLTITFK